MDKYPSVLKVGKENGCIWTIKKKKEKGFEWEVKIASMKKQRLKKW